MKKKLKKTKKPQINKFKNVIIRIRCSYCGNTHQNVQDAIDCTIKYYKTDVLPQYECLRCGCIFTNEESANECFDCHEIKITCIKCEKKFSFIDTQDSISLLGYENCSVKFWLCDDCLKESFHLGLKEA